MAFLSFNLEDVPTVERIDAEGREKVAILELNHEPNTFDRSDRSYVISRGPPSPLKIETFHGELYVPQLSEWTDGPTFMVANISTGFTIDISELVFGEPSISVRQLQEGPNIPQADSNVNVNSDQLFLMIRDNGNWTDKGGDRFFSRESDTPPRLHIRLWPPGYVPPPTLEPTISPAPSTSSPPSIQPTISSGPSISASTQPTMVASATPSAEAII